ncbi:Beta-chimaerin [Colletotrichum higginsianum IMI 349063]|uniref:Beta-chimaerin n=2 Tax=Colletotrichum higginsianum TaxID=80884 RepID=A0A1B7Y1E9_COLHI|nr:Beta-chimaerin [Colletotrichum higginsianum IMI 349063]OBR05831.1 Beta-chimaerin [Colletotrichum higginsianum IMI 349063]TIC90602.1 putative Rho-GTPase-activating protein 7 [Colletotrichum higginsianum]
MADLRSPSDDNLPSHNEQQRDRTNSMSLGITDTASAPPQNGGATAPNGAAPAGAETTSAPAADVSRQVQDVLSSDIGVATMLNQLKASIASAKEFALFLKKRSHIEESHASSLKKLSRISQETMHQPDHRQGTFAQAYSEMMYIHERMAENGTQFAQSLQQMHDDLLELAAVAERSRKGWKANGLAAEHRVSDLEAAMRKSKAKYDSLAEEYDRARTGDTSRNSGKMFSLKSKSGPQHEEDLLRKAQAADQDYQAKVQTLQSEKAELIARTRPEAISALQDLIKETDSALALQMQKFASFNEKLLLSNGLSISPIKGQSSGGPRSLREAVMAINNEKDLHDYLTSHHSKVANNNGEVKYEKNPILATARHPAMGHQPNPSVSNVPQMTPSGPSQQQQQQQQQREMPPPARPSGPPQPAESPRDFVPPNMPAAQQQRPSSQQQHQQPLPPQTQQHGRSFSTNNMLNQPSQQQQFQSNRNSGVMTSRYNGSISSQGPPQLGALPFQTSQSPPPQQQQQQPPPPPPPQQQQQQQQSQYQPPQQLRQNNPAQQYPPQGPPPGAGGFPPHHSRQSPPVGPPGPSSNAARPVFGLSLTRLYERDSLPVPMVVYQCIQAVDLYGLGVEGIYRQSGSLTHINKLKTMFDTDSSNPLLDFRNPENFYHDVNSVTGLLKQFLRDLPNPLLTTEHHSELIEAAKIEDDIIRRDSLHAIINSLPDPNYATLRSLTLHLHRVMENSHVNRMNSHNLSVIFGPTVMGTDPSTSIADAGWQIKVVDTILQNTYEIFDDE